MDCLALAAVLTFSNVYYGVSVKNGVHSVMLTWNRIWILINEYSV